MPGQTLLIRADASSQIGNGHVMRCLALAQAWRTHLGQVAFLTHDTLPQTLSKRIHDETDDLYFLSDVPGSQEDAFYTQYIARQIRANALVVDGYVFTSSYQKMLYSDDFQLVIIDDMGIAGPYYSDIILCQDIGASPELYTSRQNYTRLLLGAGYILLRTEFISWRDKRPAVSKQVKKALVTLGGADPHNVTHKVIRALQSEIFSELQVTIIVGGSNPRYDELLTICRAADFRIQQNVADMPQEMARTDVAITAAGGTALELAFMGIPMLIIISAEDQHANATGLMNAGAGISLGWCRMITTDQIQNELLRLINDFPLRHLFSQQGKNLVDGQGAVRVINEITDQNQKRRSLT